jgi:hypothetical protein
MRGHVGKVIDLPAEVGTQRICKPCHAAYKRGWERERRLIPS